MTRLTPGGERSVRGLILSACLAVLLSGCGGYRLVRLDEVEVPSYEPREVPVPARCDTLVQQAVAEGLAGLSEADARTLDFCQLQQIRRAQEEEAAARKLEAHAEAAGFALRVATVVAGATIAVLAWVF